VTRVLHLTDRLSTRGGADWHLLGVLRAQVQSGMSVCLAVGDRDGTVLKPPCPVEQQAGLGARERQPVPGLDRLRLRQRPELLHLHNVVNPWVLEWAASAPEPALMTVQDHRIFCPGRGKWTADGKRCREPMSAERCAGCFSDQSYFDSIFRLTHERLSAASRLDAFTVLSHYIKRELSAVGLPAERVRVIPPFVHGLARGGAPSGPPCVLFVGRLVAAKGPLAAVEAWRRSGLDLPLVVAGTGSARQELECLAANSDAEFLGWVPHAELGPLYRRARVLLLPCRWQEPFGIVGLEALSLGTPVAAWHSGGVAEWHPGPLVPWGDVDGLAAEAARLALDKPGGQPPPTLDAELMDRLHRLYEEISAR